MSEWKMKRFWEKAEPVAVEDGFTVHLDGRPIKTPGKAALIVPTQPLAEVMASEWQAQEEEINPNLMPVTKSANSAVDKVSTQFEAVADMLAEYAGTDLLCYRATQPMELIERQALHWDPLLDWCAETYGARLVPVAGVMFAPQEQSALERLRAVLHEMSPFELTAVHDLITLPGSLVLGLAAMKGWKSPEALWEISRLDERFQQEQWGTDEEAEEAAGIKLQAFKHAVHFYNLARS